MLDIHFLLSSPPDLLAVVQVFDGHGGESASEFAAEHLLQQVISDERFPQDTNQALVRTLVPAFSAGQSMPQLLPMLSFCIFRVSAGSWFSRD